MHRSSAEGVVKWWTAKSAGDRIILGAAGVVLILVLWYQLAWSPLDRMRRSARAELQQLAAASQLLARLPADAASVALEPQDLRNFVTEGLSAQGLVVSALETRGETLVVSFDTVSFDALVRWLGPFDTPGTVRIEAVRLDRRPEPGTVTAEIELARP